VWIAATTRAGREVAQHHNLGRLGDRERIRVLSAYLALGLVDRLAKGLPLQPQKL
jgi:hypothetical protein